MAVDKDIHKELEEISPLLSRLPKVNPYAVPEGYFDHLPAAILEEVKQAKVVHMVPRRNTWRLAVAAAVSGIIILGGWLFVEKRSPVDGAGVANTASIQTGMRQVSDTEIAAYVDRNDIAQPDDVSSDAQIGDEDVPLVLADVTDQELQQYVDQENSPVNLN